MQNREILINIIEQKLSEKNATDWITLCEQAKIPCSPINNIQQVFDDPQIQARKMKIELNHPVYGSINQVANPVKFSCTEIEYEQAPPSLGFHTEEILRSLKFDESQIKLLKSKKIV